MPHTTPTADSFPYTDVGTQDRAMILETVGPREAIDAFFLLWHKDLCHAIFAPAVHQTHRAIMKPQ